MKQYAEIFDYVAMCLQGIGRPSQPLPIPYIEGMPMPLQCVATCSHVLVRYGNRIENFIRVSLKCDQWLVKLECVCCF